MQVEVVLNMCVPVPAFASVCVGAGGGGAESVCVSAPALNLCAGAGGGGAEGHLGHCRVHGRRSAVRMRLTLHTSWLGTLHVTRGPM